MPDRQDPELSIEWLRGKLVGLLNSAAEGQDPDHQACAKYADILYKMLPKGSSEQRGIPQGELERARQAVLSSRKPAKPPKADPSPESKEI